MDISHPISREIKATSFSFYSPEEILKLSVKQIYNPITNNNLNHPNPGGLNDPALGPVDKDSSCATCSLSYFQCPGHFGHIELSSICYNPITFKLLRKLLSSICLYCHHFRTSRTQVYHIGAKLRLIHAGLILEATELDDVISYKWKQKSKKKKTEKKSSSDNNDKVIVDETIEESDDEMDIDEPAEAVGEEELDSQPMSEGDFIKKIEDFVTECFDKKEKLSANNAYSKNRTILATDTIREVEKLFLSSIPTQSCANCKGQSPKFRSEGMIKIFQKPLGAKQKKAMVSKGMTLYPLTCHSSISPINKLKIKNEENSDDDSTDEREPSKSKTNEEETTRYLSAIEVYEHMERLWKKEENILHLLYGSLSSNNIRTSNHSMFFIKYLPVPPNKFRPTSKMNGQIFESPQNGYLADVLKANLIIMDINENRSIDSSQKMVNALVILQSNVNNFIDSTAAPSVGGKIPAPGIRQLLEKKEGLFRKHMMGKRVNYAARSVISPDFNIETNEIGIPPPFALKLTYPEPVTTHNIDELREAVIRGPDVWPGATQVQNEDGSILKLAMFDEAGRTAIANQLLTPTIAAGTDADGTLPSVNKKVFRHIKNGDFLLLNRQPTLHKPSIMCHTARILPGERTIRMHYANCNTYNADFDGDEMNMHFPQNSIARAEAMLIARTDQQYLVPTDGGVLRGLIQDHVCAGVEMTKKDSTFTREEYFQLIYISLRPEGFKAVGGVSGSNGNIEEEVILGDCGKILTLPPAVIKPKQLWTGKQVISTVLLNLSAKSHGLNLRSKSKIPAKAWGKIAEEEQTVLVVDGQLLTGILDKAQFGASAHGLVHAVYETYGAPQAGKLLTIFGRLFSAYLQFVGFSCRMDDLTLNKTGDKIRRKLINEANGIGLSAAKDFVGLNQNHITNESAELKTKLEAVLRNKEKMAGLDSAMKSKTNPVTSEIISKCIPDTLSKPFPKNNMQMMIVSGAKGSAVNVSQISCLLGQQELEGRRVPTMISGKTLPSFLPFETSASAGGFITGRFLTGIKPSEYYFHCMAGREGLIDTAVKTSRSGYLQRCLIKGLEGLKVDYDHTVRDSDGSVIQFRYGEDGLDVLKQVYLEKFDFCALNYYTLANRLSVCNDYINETAATAYREKNLRTLKKMKKGAKISKVAGYHVGKYEDPVLSKFNPSRYLGAVSERFAENLHNFIEKNEEGLIDVIDSSNHKKRIWAGKSPKQENFQAMMNLKYQQSLAEPGDAVGLLAAQSIGEPSTQMTLNTFHFAGLGTKNVTLGIPRLREIVMTASPTIKTPLMKMHLLPTATIPDGEKLVKRLNKIILTQFIDKVLIEETFIGNSSTPERKVVKIKLIFWPKKNYETEFGIESEDLKSTIENFFLKQLERLVGRELKSRLREATAEVILSSKKSVSKSTANEDDEGETEHKKKSKKFRDDDQASESEMDSDSDGEDNATKEKIKRKKTQQATYENDTEEEEEIEDEKVADIDDDDNSSDVDKFTNNVNSEKLKTNTAGKTEILSCLDYVSDYNFEKTGKWCEIELSFPADVKKLLILSIAEQALKFTVVKEIPNISRGFIMDNDATNDKTVSVGTEGINFQEIFDPNLNSGLIDLNTVTTNDVFAMMKTYGIEAARATIVNEIAGVFAVYGINVNPRHLNLIADFMTFEGGYKAFNRMGMRSNPSPFAQMSFETTTQFLVTSTLAGERDPLNSPSACLVAGKVVEGGTGSFQVVHPISI
ncbi:hypothetical protein HK099_006394 [Clydaea vesicula]|uniref:DNA-directed RNA polymerase subunit n=1 Tax=Clydaea vesicula TaxID=447962 RepID=A0AAD5TXV7_9FUNG|nr:hypothetical protein HK099_006394 [Clydaea vesicula]